MAVQQNVPVNALWRVEKYVRCRAKPELALRWVKHSEHPVMEFGKLSMTQQLAVLELATAHEAASLLLVGIPSHTAMPPSKADR